MLKIFRKILRLKYLVNISSYEIHNLDNTTKACGIDKMAKHNKWYITEKRYKQLLAENSDFNGCIHCNREYDTDKF